MIVENQFRGNVSFVENPLYGDCPLKVREYFAPLVVGQNIDGLTPSKKESIDDLNVQPAAAEYLARHGITQERGKIISALFPAMPNIAPKKYSEPRTLDGRAVMTKGGEVLGIPQGRTPALETRFVNIAEKQERKMDRLLMFTTSFHLEYLE